ncbi:MAG: hypothetical protein LKJ47_01450 [Bifidobacteriaceae bacterium]|jgi:hypothetical protein|nr:hypothetical protein [Bifidobacteriaceae bacterium]
MADTTGNKANDALLHKLQESPQIASLMKNVDSARAAAEKANAAEGNDPEGVQKAMKRNKDEQELAPGNPRSLQQMEEVAPRGDDEDTVAYLDRIFG